MGRFPFSWAGDRATNRGECRASVAPIGPAAQPAGYSGAAGMQIIQRIRRRYLTRTAKQVLANPHLMRRLSDRVYALWEEDLRQQRDRAHPTSRFR